MNIERRLNIATWTAWQMWGTFYGWGGDDPSLFDCSGVCVELGKSIGVIKRRDDFSSGGLWEALKDYRLSGPKAGALVFYGLLGVVTHVEFCLDSESAIGASGGSRRVKSREDAIKYNAFIKVRPIERNREIIGYADFIAVEGFLKH